MTVDVDRRVQRTRQSLIKALMELIAERGYDAVTIHDITRRADVGRTTFYLHYRSKEDLFFSGHLYGIDVHYDHFTREQLLADDPPPMMTTLFQYGKDNRLLYHVMTQSQDKYTIVRAIKERVVSVLEASLHAAFDEADSAIPFDMLATYIAGAQLEFMEWWAITRTNYTAEYAAQMMHRIQRAAIRDALGLP